MLSSKTSRRGIERVQEFTVSIRILKLSIVEMSIMFARRMRIQSTGYFLKQANYFDVHVNNTEKQLRWQRQEWYMHRLLRFRSGAYD